MSASVSRTIGLIGRAVQGRLAVCARACVPGARTNQFQQPSLAQLGTGSTRSVWYMTSQINRNKQYDHHSLKCSCCGLHTQGDIEIANFLAEEIKVEKQNEKTKGTLPSIKGFNVTKSESADVEFQKQNGNETITIKFNVNHSVEDDFGPEEQPSENQTQMMSKPAFVVEINKGGNQSLAIQCIFPPPEDMGQQGEGQYEDEIEIQDVTFTDKGSDWEDKCYTVAGSIMDGNLYDMLLTMLEERGVDADFVEQLVEFSTAYEHKQYIDFLEKLKDFASKE